MSEVKAPCENVIPMGEWIKGGVEDECRPCLLGVTSQWYRDELLEQGYEEAASRIGDLSEKTDLSPEDICQALDKIKSEVPEELHKRLLDFDCATQNFDGKEESTDG